MATERSAAQAAADDYTATIAGLNDQLNTARTDSANAQTQAKNLGADKLALSRQITGLKAALEKAMADTVAAQKALDQTVADADKKAPTSKSALNQARDVQITTLEQRLDEERRKVETLQKQLDDQTEAAARVVADPPVIDNPASETGQSVPTAGLVPRDRQMVDTIIGTTRGVGFLDDEKKQRLKDQLASGACITDALESVFDKVPLILMRNLMRDFKSDC
jgi:ABC-type transporter Mla subunit MlaD